MQAEAEQWTQRHPGLQGERHAPGRRPAGTERTRDGRGGGGASEAKSAAETSGGSAAERGGGQTARETEAAGLGTQRLRGARTRREGCAPTCAPAERGGRRRSPRRPRGLGWRVGGPGPSGDSSRPRPRPGRARPPLTPPLSLPLTPLSLRPTEDSQRGETLHRASVPQSHQPGCPQVANPLASSPSSPAPPI